MSNAKKVSFENRDKYIQVGKNISSYRKMIGMTQEELAEKIGISRSHLSAIEAPNMMRPFSHEILFNIAAVLNVPPNKLLTIKDDL